MRSSRFFSSFDRRTDRLPPAAGSIFMDDVHVPASNILNVEGLKGPFSCLKCVSRPDPSSVIVLVLVLTPCLADSNARFGIAYAVFLLSSFFSLLSTS